MSIFSTILNKIFHPTASAAEPSQQPGAPNNGSAGTPQTSPASASPPSASGAPAQNVDVEKVLTDLAAKKGGGKQ